MLGDEHIEVIRAVINENADTDKKQNKTKTFDIQIIDMQFYNSNWKRFTKAIWFIAFSIRISRNESKLLQTL